MNAIAKNDFGINQSGRLIEIRKGEPLEFILDEGTTDESGEIRINGQYLCDNHSPFAEKHIDIVSDEELEAYETPKDNDECSADRLYRIKNEGVSDLPPEDVEWLINQAETAQTYRKTLTEIADMNFSESNSVDAAYWAGLAIGRL